jgi:hypothetical protein
MFRGLNVSVVFEDVFVGKQYGLAFILVLINFNATFKIVKSIHIKKNFYFVLRKIEQWQRIYSVSPPKAETIEKF